MAREARPRYELDLVSGKNGRSFRDECCDDGRLVVFPAEGLASNLAVQLRELTT